MNLKLSLDTCHQQTPSRPYGHVEPAPCYCGFYSLQFRVDGSLSGLYLQHLRRSLDTSICVSSFFPSVGIFDYFVCLSASHFHIRRSTTPYISPTVLRRAFLRRRRCILRGQNR